MCDKACAASQKEFELIKLQREAQPEKLEFFRRNSRSPEEKLENMCETKPSRFETDSHFQQQERSHRRQNTERSQNGYWKWPMYPSELDTLKLARYQGINNSLLPTRLHKDL